MSVCLFGLPPCVSTSPLALLTLSLDLWNCLINPAYGFYFGFRLNSITEYFATNESSGGFSAPSSFRLSERVVEKLPGTTQQTAIRKRPFNPLHSIASLALHINGKTGMPDKFDGSAGHVVGLFVKSVSMWKAKEISFLLREVNARS